MRRGARLLLYLGTIVVVLGMGKVHAAYIGDYDYSGSSRFSWSLVYVLLLGLAAYGVGLPELARGRAAWGSAVAAAASAALAISLVQLVAGSALLPRFVVAGSVLLLVPWYALCSSAAAGSRSRGEQRDRVVAVVGSEEERALRFDLGRHPERPASLAVALDAAAASGSGHAQPLSDAVTQHRASVVVLDRAAQADERVVRQAARLHEGGVRVRTLSLFYDEWLGKLPVSELERVALMFDIGEIHRARYGRVKRLLDVVVAAAGLVVLLVLLVPVWLINLVANRGPLLYRQERTGKGGRPFAILKLRTMRPGGGQEWTEANDPRITPFGRFLRRTHLDELPQVVNILRGDLALVGPRPEQPRYVAELTDKVPFYELRHLVRPGLTGWAQVKYDYGASDLDALEKLQYEFFYLRHQSLTMDLRILGRTVRAVLRGGGR
jgi:lipopolysaccharide/colanic/teichoic acid biosynthesis glycosyltransferase